MAVRGAAAHFGYSWRYAAGMIGIYQADLTMDDSPPGRRFDPDLYGARPGRDIRQFRAANYDYGKRHRRADQARNSRR